MNFPKPASKEDLLATLDEIRAGVESGDSLEGHISWSMPYPPEDPEDADFMVRAVYRVGNLMGQGGVVGYGEMDAPGTQMGNGGPVALDAVFLMYAFRYALGRQSYAVKDVADALIERRAWLRPDWRAQIIRDIEEAIEHGRAGHEQDVRRWREVAEKL